MQRCLQLAALAKGNVAPNPMVGAVLVHEERIIGEGYHTAYGAPHAEPACLASVKSEDRSLIGNSVLYVSLEPCSHFGKTPPCADFIIEKGIKKVVIGCTDPFPKVSGRGIEKLKASGIEVITDVLQEACILLNKRFFTFHRRQRPYIILKWAQSVNGKINSLEAKRLKISHAQTDRLVHQWRSEEASILVGTNTAMLDDPALTTRLAPGKHPVRLVIDKSLRLPLSLQLFNGRHQTIVFNTRKEAQDENITYIKLNDGPSFLYNMMQALYDMNLQSVMVEGGAALLQSLIEQSLWDEARIITNESMYVPKGIAAPTLHNAQLLNSLHLRHDVIHFYRSLNFQP